MGDLGTSTLVPNLHTILVTKSQNIQKTALALVLIHPI